MGLDGNGEYIASTSCTNYLGIFLAIKMVAIWKMAEMQYWLKIGKGNFPYLIMANIFARARIRHKCNLHKFS